MWHLKYNTNEIICKTETDSQAQRADLWSPRGRLQLGRQGWEFGIDRGKLTHIQWVNNQVLLWSTGSYTQYPVINHNGKEYEKECAYICIYIYIQTESHCCTAEINTILLISDTSKKFLKNEKVKNHRTTPFHDIVKSILNDLIYDTPLYLYLTVT